MRHRTGGTALAPVGIRIARRGRSLSQDGRTGRRIGRGRWGGSGGEGSDEEMCRNGAIGVGERGSRSFIRGVVHRRFAQVGECQINGGIRVGIGGDTDGAVRFDRVGGRVGLLRCDGRDTAGVFGSTRRGWRFDIHDGNDECGGLQLGGDGVRAVCAESGVRGEDGGGCRPCEGFSDGVYAADGEWRKSARYVAHFHKAVKKDQ
mmetsp:Transcript_41056/g.86126  ORF Transcript_41056/g.86126 Transcript_41056/m.86126 type:complete len:204 (+) Transcript_41056:402-1013(+)